jgi:carbamoyltransferase
LSYILGLNINHADTSACIFNNFNLVAAAEEERFTRKKHEMSFPSNAIRFCLTKANINISQVDYVSINSKPLSSIQKKIFFLLLNPKNYPLIFQSLFNTKVKFSIKDSLNLIDKNNFFKGDVKYFDHHLSHLASSFYYSPFKKSVNLSVDGFGDFASCSWGSAKNNVLKIDNKIFFPHSLGIFYQALTQYLGFKNYGDEYKVMGLSSYGKPIYVNQISNLISYKEKLKFELNLNFFLHHKKKILIIKNDQPFFRDLYSKELENLLGPERKSKEEINQRHKDIAKSTQVVYENVFFNLLNDLYEKYNIKNLNLSGGCVMNSVANGKIIFNTKFKNIYTSSNPGDAGGSIGSALCLINKIYKKKKNFSFSNLSPYIGDSFSNDEVEAVINKYKLSKKFDVKKIETHKLCELVANYISRAYIVGWFQDGMEWGPRALGSRSILADPRNPKMKQILNLKIKKRENFRPFAPSILYKFMDRWFEVKKPVPYMSEVYKIKKNKRKLIPAVTHVDGTGRLQTVTKENGRFYSLLSEFYKKTKVPIILNTSFNENEPIVRTPEHAIDCYLRTEMDILVIQDWIIKRI